MFEQINKDLITAMKESNKDTLSVLRLLKSSLQLEKINLKKDLSDDEVINVIRKQIKIRKDSIEEYTKYNKLEQVESLKKEIEIMSKYLPPEMSLEDINKKIDEVFKEINPNGIKDMGKCMKLAGEKIKNADMGLISKLIKERLG
jgi:uncharacterized protein